MALFAIQRDVFEDLERFESRTAVSRQSVDSAVGNSLGYGSTTAFTSNEGMEIR